jgi:hypothetical protein
MHRLAFALLLVACSNASGGSGDDTSCEADGTCGGDGCNSPDVDGDGWSDEVEIAMETSATDAADNPTVRGQRVFVMPFQAPAHPAKHEVDANAKLARADVAILLDTTGSMLGTYSRIQGELAEIAQGLEAQIPDVAIGAAGYGDFPVYDGANSQYDVPFYLVHRMMTVRTPAGLASITNSFQYANIIVDGLGNWFAGMRGGDEPEQHWEALRQTATGVGITYPDPFNANATRSVPPFSAQTAYPTTIPAGEEAGTIGGLGFRRDATPIIIQITDTNAQPGGLTTTSPVSATRAVALGSLKAIGARVVGVMAWITVGEDDLTAMTIDTGGLVTPDAWGTGAARPANCPIGKCCVVAEDEIVRPQPDPINGKCPLVFQADRYSQNLSQMIVQAVAAIANGAHFQIAAEVRDDPSDDLDVADSFVESVTTCDGEPFADVVSGAAVCFRITAKPNTVIDNAAEARRYRATLQLTGDGVGSFTSHEVFFVVPSKTCAPPVLL